MQRELTKVQHTNVPVEGLVIFPIRQEPHVHGQCWHCNHLPQQQQDYPPIPLRKQNSLRPMLGMESILQLGPFTHRTNAAQKIIETGTLCQQKRKGGINLCIGKNGNRASATHEIEVDAELAFKWEYTFFGNRFSHEIFATGQWVDGCWEGKVPAEFLTIKSVSISKFLQ